MPSSAAATSSGDGVAAESLAGKPSVEENERVMPAAGVVDREGDGDGDARGDGETLGLVLGQDSETLS